MRFRQVPKESFASKVSPATGFLRMPCVQSVFAGRMRLRLWLLMAGDERDTTNGPDARCNVARNYGHHFAPRCDFVPSQSRVPPGQGRLDVQ